MSYEQTELKTKHLGSQAENFVCEYLIEQGLQYVTKNYYAAGSEIDLIMRDTTHLIFVEVRFRDKQEYGKSIETISRQKQNRIIRTATYYLQENNLFNKVFCRFDVVGLNGNGELCWIKDAFQVKD